MVLYQVKSNVVWFDFEETKLNIFQFILLIDKIVKYVLIVIIKKTKYSSILLSPNSIVYCIVTNIRPFEHPAP